MAIESATASNVSSSRSRVARVHAIHVAACNLVIERGYDGFTMDDLAHACGISRRTLFNYIPDKASAVLGSVTEGDIDAVQAFRRGEPTGELIPDLIATFEVIIEQDDAFEAKTLEHHQLLEKAIASDPKVMALATGRFEDVTRLISNVVCAREGWPDDDLRARALAAHMLALIKLSLEELSRRNEGADFLKIFHEVLAADNAVRTH